MVFMVFLLSFSLRPTTSLESVQQFFNSQANTEQYAIIGPIFQAFWLNCYDGKTEPTGRRASFISSFFNKRREKSLISSPSFSKLNQR
jgi:hypothetical protein